MIRKVVWAGVVFNFFSLSSRERMQAPWIITWVIVIFCSRKAIQGVPKITNRTNLPWKWCCYEACYLPSCSFVCYWLKDILPSEPHRSFSRLFFIAGQWQTAVCTLWIGGHLENYFSLAPDLLENSIVCFPPFYTITKRQVIGSPCNFSFLLNQFVKFESSWKKNDL